MSNANVTATVNKLAAHPVGNLLSCDWDAGDVWGSAMAEGLALCDVATARGYSIPESLGFSSGAAVIDEEYIREEDGVMGSDILDALDSGNITGEQISEYLGLLSETLEEFESAGLSY